MDLIIKNNDKVPHLVRLKKLEASFIEEGQEENQATAATDEVKTSRRTGKKAESATETAIYENNT